MPAGGPCGGIGALEFEVKLALGVGLLEGGVFVVLGEPGLEGAKFSGAWCSGGVCFEVGQVFLGEITVKVAIQGLEAGFGGLGLW